jgi:hypothetical protein
MKKFVCFFLLLFAFNAYSQSTNMFGKDPLINFENWDKQRLYYGFFLGFNSYDFKINYKKAIDEDIAIESSTGFNVGLVSDLRLQDHINLRFEPGLYYTQRNLMYPKGVGITRELDQLREVKSTYIHFPILLKFSSLRTGNVRPYLEGGLSATLNLSNNAKSKEDNFEQNFRMIPWSTNYELGFGVDLYFEYFKFSPSIRGVFGTKDELVRDNDPNSPWTSNIESMRTRAVFINFTFH